MMDVILLIKSFAGLSVALAVLIFLYLYMLHAKQEKKQKKKKKRAQHIKEVIPKFSMLYEVIRNKKATQEELSEAVDLIIKHYGDIPKKRGLRADPKFEYYSEILLRLCHHPSTNKNIILKFDRELEKRNPSYKVELDDSLTKGLNTRGI